ncbi:DMT family transporter [Leptospira ilyithenensis]|uniref:DMT family transporter n=1 Tax=Leptospira ilyithenensis TaxID=2484901 RepID=A0A4R9LP51_9LEPT|nr:DMT family transporter [Leptospira ilyithenensis]TGN10545.1 DMT family transporter [Leptospira ilyithenensis]
MTGNERKGYFFVFLTGVFFAFEVIGFKEIFRRYQLPPEIAAFYGVFGSFILVSTFFLFRKTNRDKVILTVKRDGKVLLLGTFLNSIGIILYYQALRISDLGPSAILIKTTVLYNVLLGVLFLKETLRNFEVLGIILSLAGIYFISTLGGQISVESSVLILISAFFFASQSYLIKRFVPEILGLEFAYLRLLLLSVFFIGYIHSIGTWEVLSTEVILALTFFSLLGYFLGRAFYFQAHNYLPIGKLNATLLIEPIFLMGIGILYMEEPFSARKLVGSGLILFGLYLLVFHKRKQTRPA